MADDHESLRPELSELLQQYNITREQLDAWSELVPSKLPKVLEGNVDHDTYLDMMCWRAVELGEMTYEGDGHFSLVEPKEVPVSELYVVGDHAVKLTQGPVEGMEELILTLDGFGWTLTELTTNGDKWVPKTRIVLSK